MQISIQENHRHAIKYALGVALIEILYVRLSLKGMNWVMDNQRIFHILEWCTVFLFLVLAVSSFVTARIKEGTQKNIILKSNVNRFILGVTMSAVNPVQIPFWFIWSTYLLSNQFLEKTAVDFNVYTTGIGIGTLLGFAVFIYAGKWMVKKLNASHQIINLIVAFIFLASAIIQLYRVLYKPFNEQLKGKSSLENRR